MKGLIKVFVVAVLVAMVGVAFAGEGKKGNKKPAGIMGKFVKVDGEKIVIKTKEGEKTILTDASTKVTINNEADKKIADLKEGQMVVVLPEDASETKAATDITAKDAGEHKGGGKGGKKGGKKGGEEN